MTDKGLTVCLDCDAIVIRLPINALKHAVPYALDPWDEKWKVTDASIFAQAVLQELSNEKEDGTTIVHEMFDETFRRAVENGAEGIEEEHTQPTAPLGDRWTRRT